MSTETPSAAIPHNLTLSKVEIEEAGPACKRLTIEISKESVDERMSFMLSDVASRVALPGFRPGKAPRKLVQRRLGQELHDETKQKLHVEAYQQAVKDNELRVLGDPIIKDEEDAGVLEAGQPLSFRVEVEIYPEFDIPSLDDVKIYRPMVEVTDEMVDEQVTAYCRTHGEVKPITRDPEPGDLFAGSVTVSSLEGDQPEAVARNPSIAIRWPREDSDGSGQVAGFIVENLGEHLKDKERGDTVTIDTVGPEQHEILAIRGKNVRIEYVIEEIAEAIPAEPEELAVRLGAADVDDFREKLREALQAKAETEQQDVLRRQAARYLMDNIEFDLPGRITSAQAERTLQNARVDMLSRGVPEYMIEERLAELRTASDEQARRDLKMHFIMEKLAADYEITVEEPEINARIFQIARDTQKRPDKVRDEIMESGSGPALVTTIRHEKAADRVVEQVSVEDVSVDEWNRLMEQEDESVEGSSDDSSAKAKDSKSD